MKLKAALTLTACSTALVLTACSTASSTGGSTTSSTAAQANTSAAANAAASTSTGATGAESLTQYTSVPTALPITTPLSAKPPTGKKVVFLQNGQKPGQQFSAALKGAVTPLGWTEQDINFDASNPAAVGSAFQQAVNGGANVIEVQGLDAALYEKFVPAARAKHIIVVDTVTSGKKIPGVTYVDRSDSAGKPQAEIAVAAILADAAPRKVTAHVLKIGSVLTTSILTPFMNDIDADLKAKCSACTDALYNLSAQASISNQVAAPVVSYLQSHRDINYIVVSNGAFGIGLLPAIKAAGLGSSIKLIGATPLPPQIQDLKNGDPQTIGWIANSIVVVGWMSIDAAARVLVGDSAAQYANVAAPTWLLTKLSGRALVPNPVAPVDYATKYAAMWRVSS